MNKAKGKDEDGVVDAIVQKAYERLGRFLKGEAEYLAGRIAALNRRACLYKGKPCAVRARAEITGMVSVLSALGWEVVCDWDRYDSGVGIVPVEIIGDMIQALFDSHKRINSASRGGRDGTEREVAK